MCGVWLVSAKVMEQVWDEVFCVASWGKIFWRHVNTNAITRKRTNWHIHTILAILAKLFPWILCAKSMSRSSSCVHGPCQQHAHAGVTQRNLRFNLKFFEILCSKCTLMEGKVRDDVVPEYLHVLVPISVTVLGHEITCRVLRTCALVLYA